MKQEIFRDKSLKHIKRVIGFIDSDPKSKTFGCVDRYYWHYKLYDYYNARFQEAALTLAFYYLEKNSELYQNKNLLDLIRGVINFWITNLNKNGSVNEVFPHEQSFCATSFSAYTITEAIEMLDLKDEFESSVFIKTAKWLRKNGNWHISNQIAASALALYNIGKISGKKELVKESQSRIEKLIDMHSKLRFFPEYNGFDLGYNTITMSLLARYYQKTKDKKILEVLKQANNYITPYLDKYSRYDNIKMSRQTEFIYPFSFKITGSPVLQKIISGLEKDKILNPDWLDDRYLIGLSNDYLMTYYL